MPGTEALKIPHKFGEIPPPGKPDGNGKARPVRKISSLPEIGTVVVQVLVLLSNEVVASNHRLRVAVAFFAVDLDDFARFVTGNDDIVRGSSSW
jgi:hypothetical protein